MTTNVCVLDEKSRLWVRWTFCLAARFCNFISRFAPSKWGSILVVSSPVTSEAILKAMGFCQLEIYRAGDENAFCDEENHSRLWRAFCPAARFCTSTFSYQKEVSQYHLPWLLESNFNAKSSKDFFHLEKAFVIDQTHVSGWKGRLWAWVAFWCVIRSLVFTF